MSIRDRAGNNRDSVTEGDRALALAPDDIYALNNKGLCLIQLGKLQAQSSQNEEAFTAFRSALALFSHSLELDPNPNNTAIRNLRDNLQQLFDSQGQ